MYIRIALLVIFLSLFALHLSAAPSPDTAISYRLERRDGRAVIVASDGTLIPWAMYTDSADADGLQWLNKHRGFIKMGNHRWQINVYAPPGAGYFANPYWSLDGKPLVFTPNALDLDTKAKLLLSEDQQALFEVRMVAQPDIPWQKAHLDEYATLDGLAPEQSKQLCVNPSFASDLYIAGLERMIRDVVAYVEGKSWHNRVFAYTLFPYGEGTTESAIVGQPFENSRVMQRAFAQFVREKYHTDQALQTAWMDPTMTLDTVKTPTLEGLKEKRERLHMLHWPAPGQVQREKDYYLLQEQLFARYVRTIFATMADATKARPVLKGADMLKQPIMGWTLIPEFEGTWNRETAADYGNVFLATGSINAAHLLDEPGMDMLQTPAIYYNRAVGYAWEAEGCVDSLALRGKVNYVEGDMRTWAALDNDGKYSERNLSPDAGTFRTPAEMEAGFDRTLAWAASRNMMYYYTSVCGQNRWYDDPLVAKKVDQQLKAISELPKHPWRETRDAVCMVIDDSSGLEEDFSCAYQNLAVFRQMQEGLALCGIPYRVHLFEDLQRDDFPHYKVYLFPNLFRLTPERMALLRQKVLRDGNVAIFGPATGISDGATLTATPASTLFGVPMELHMKSSPRRVMFQDNGHPISRGLPTAIYTDEYAYGPILTPVAKRLLPGETSARTLGSSFYYYGIDRPGLFVNEFGLGAAKSGKKGLRAAGVLARAAGDYAVVFSSAVPLPPELLRECARYAGCTVWSEQNAVVYGCDTFVALHSVKSGPTTIHLPRRCRVRDFYTGKVLAAQTDKITVDITAPATKMYWLE